MPHNNHCDAQHRAVNAVVEHTAKRHCMSGTEQTHNTGVHTTHTQVTHLREQLAAGQERVGGAHIHEDVVEGILRLGGYVGQEFSRVVPRPLALFRQVACVCVG